MRELWDEMEALLPQAQRPARYIDHEWGSSRNEQADYRFCLVYPDTYEIGQANQALRILCNVVNADSSFEAQRGFLPAPEFGDLMRKQNLPLCSLESCSPLADFDAVGITLPHELAATNVLEVLDLAGIPLHSCARDEGHPLVLGGGPCALNPEPYAPFFDAFCIGEAEEALPELLRLHRNLKEAGASRKEALLALAEIPGIYVPSVYDRASASPTPIVRRVFKGFAKSPAYEPCIVPFTEVVHDRLNVEVLRGCTRGCRFCQAGMMYRPVRERSAGNIVEGVLRGLAETGYDEVSLTSLSTTDHSQIAEILDRLNTACAGKGIRISIPSQRLDAFGIDMAVKVAGGKRGGLTFAPEAGSQRLRDVINKNVTEEDLLQAVESAFSQGWRRCKLYFMVGLPTETDEDLVAIADLVEAAYRKAREHTDSSRKGSVKLSVSLALFVPKPHTPFQWDGQISSDEARRRVELVRRNVRSRAIDVSWHDPATSTIEAVLSRGGRSCAAWIEAAWKHGARFDAWTEHFSQEAWDKAADELGFDARERARKEFPRGGTLPWSHIDVGVSQDFLEREREYADRGETTSDCSFGACSDCGACMGQGNEGLSPEIAGVRHA